jgi:vancomycin resistance protein VanJ
VTFLEVWRRVLLMTFRVFAGAYIVSSYGALFLHFVVGEGPTDLTAFANSVMHITLLGAFPLIVLSLVLRQWSLAILAVPLSVVWLAWFGVYLMPRSVAPVDADTPTLTVLTYNVLALNGDVEAVAQVIQAADADIINLQELSTPTAAYLEQFLAKDYPYFALYPGGIPGSGVFSRYPIVEEMMWKTRLNHQRYTIDFNGQLVIVYNTHPVSPLGGMNGFNRRHRDIDSLLDRALPDVATQMPVILAGDFNMTEISDDYDRIRETFDDAYRDVGSGMGFTYTIRGRLPVARIDYVFYTSQFRVISADVLSDRGSSDHYPLLVTFALETAS